MNNDMSVLRELQIVELKILKEVVRICEKHSLEYFAIDGTLLGAVRHGGFIPWDDDVDIGLPRDSFERFVELAPKELPSSMSINYLNPLWHLPAKKGKNHSKNAAFPFFRFVLSNLNMRCEN